MVISATLLCAEVISLHLSQGSVKYLAATQRSFSLGLSDPEDLRKFFVEEELWGNWPTFQRQSGQ